MKNKFYVWVIDFNTGEPSKYDILPYLSDSWGDLKPASKQKALGDLQEWVKSQLMYQFWSRCEYEMLILPWPNKDSDKPRKVDVYQQALPNLPLITKLFAENEKLTGKISGSQE